MKTSVFKLTWRSIRTFFGRYMAILLIVAISVGFFAGLKITQDAMINTGNDYLTSQALYDFRLFSTLGFTESDVDELSSADGVSIAEGSFSLDAMMTLEGDTQPLKLMSLPKEVNIPSVSAGRLPENDGECVADDERFDEDDIGKTITVSDENDENVGESLEVTEYTIVGLVDSPLYIGLDRGSTDMGTGALHSFIYIPSGSFTSDIFTEVNIKLSENEYIYSDEYDDLIDRYESDVTELCRRLADERYDELFAEIVVPPELAAYGVTAEQLAEEAGLTEPDTFVLTRSENAGYVSFKNDTAIVSGIANIFPVFFIVIAMLVCITTMTRMVDEERTQIGVLKALGFSDGRIMTKYLLYAGSATVIGWAIGYFVCTWGLPEIFWFAYNAIYDFTSLEYLFDLKLAILTLLVSLIGILGATVISCRKELTSVPAKLIRPRASKKGKRILLERITPLWKHFKFLQKITLRNMFRYKRRLVMMIVGISCCAGLVLTAFGVRDSMINIGTLQYGDIQTYQIEASFEEGTEGSLREKLDGMTEIDSYQTASVHRVDVSAEESISSVSMMSFHDVGQLSDFWNFRKDGEEVAMPERGEAIISIKIADKLELEIGDRLTIRDADLNTLEVTVSGIFESYINNFIAISEETHIDHFGKWEANTAMISTADDSEDLLRTLTEMDEITSISRLSTTRKNIDDALSCLNYIIWLVIGFSGALAFIVIFNLTNINLAERSREIATVEVLGFYPHETESYVLRENLILSVISSFIGLPLGILFHRIVMSMILIDMMSFPVIINRISYVLTIICTILFAVIVDQFMKRQIAKIKMAESLKAVE